MDDILPWATGQRCATKWPNDVYVHGRKLAGILCEAINGKQGNSLVVGIGPNHTSSFGDKELKGFAAHARPPISLHELTDSPGDAQELITAIRRYLLEGLGMLKLDNGQPCTGKSASEIGFMSDPYASRTRAKPRGHCQRHRSDGYYVLSDSLAASGAFRADTFVRPFKW